MLRFAARSRGYMHLDGDSYVEGSGGVGLAATLYALQSVRGMKSQAVGGTSLSQAKDRVLASTTFVQGPLIVWDGSPDGFGTVDAYMQCFADMAEWQGDGRYIFITPLRRQNQSAGDKTATAQIRTAMLAAYPDNMIDAQALLDDGTGFVDEDYFQPGGVHLAQPAMDIVTADVDALLDANRW